MIQKKYLILIVSVLVLVSAVGFAVYISIKNDNDQYQLTEESSGESTSNYIVELDDSAYPKLLSEDNKKEITDSLLKRTSYDTKKAKSVVGVVRKESLTKPSETEQTFVIDTEEIQTSYLISLYKENEVNIINVLCVPKDQQVYKKDYCYEA